MPLYLLSCILMFFLQVSVWTYGIADNDVAKVKPSLTNCSVISIRSLQLLCSVKHNVTLQWIMAKDVMKEVDNYYLYCKCHDYKTGVTKIHMPNQCGTNQCLPMQYSFILAVETCIDQCECQVYAKPQGGGFLNEYWSNSCSFSIGPSVPLASPNLLQSVIKVVKNKSLQVFFKLPSLEKCYCDDDLIRSVSVDVVYNSTEFMKYHINYDNIEKMNDTYKCIVLLNSFYFWNTINLSLSVNNSIGASPYSDYYTINGAINCDITPGSYRLSYENISSASVSFYWQLSHVVKSLLESGFITGSQYRLMFLNGTGVKSHISNDINFTLSDLNPGQWYFICVSLSTTDNNSWPPDSSCLNFETRQDANNWEATHADDNNDVKYEIIVWIVLPILGCVVVFSVIFALCLKPYCFKEPEVTSPRVTPEMSVSMGLSESTFPKHECSDVESLKDVPPYNQDNQSSFQEPNNDTVPDTE